MTNNLSKTTYLRATLEGNDSDKLDFIGFLNSHPEGMDFTIRSAGSDTSYYQPYDEETDASEPI